MSDIGCAEIRNVLTDVVKKIEWNDYMYTFTRNKDWYDPDALFVLEVTPSVDEFLRAYKESGVFLTKASILSSDQPQMIHSTDFSNTKSEKKLSSLLLRSGWQSIFVFTHYGFGGALGMTTFFHKEKEIAVELVKETTDYLTPLLGQFNAWARKLVNEKSLYSAEALTTREIDCMVLVGDGKTSEDIARLLGITKRTVDFHIDNCVDKLGASSRSQAVALLFASTFPQLNRITRYELNI